MRIVKKTISLLLCALLTVSALCGCSADGQTEGGGEAEAFIVSACVCAPLAALDPAHCDDPAAETVFHAVYENLMRLGTDEDGNPAVLPAVAREYETVENYDGTVDYVFTLRSAARWSDGRRVKAGDFVYAWRRLVNPATQSPYAALLANVQGYDAARESGDATRLAVVAEGDSTLRVTLSAPNPYFLADVCTAVATMPLRSDAAGSGDGWAASGSLPCNGAFRVGAWIGRQSLYLRRNEYYYGASTVAPDALRFLFADGAEDVARYCAEDPADYVSPVPEGVPAALYLNARSVACVLYNHMSDSFSNEHLRRAFDLALDRESVAAAAGSAMTGATGLVPHGVLNDPEAGGADFRGVGGDLLAAPDEGLAERRAEAENELRLSGYQEENTESPALTLVYPEGDAALARAAEAAVKNWNGVLRLNVRAEALERETFDARIAAGEYDLAADVLSGDGGSDAMAFLEPYAGLDAANALHYVSKPYDLLIAVARTSRDGAARAAILHDAEALLLDDTALSPLYFGGTGCAFSDALRGVAHDLRGSAYFDAVRISEAEP